MSSPAPSDRSQHIALARFAYVSRVEELIRQGVPVRAALKEVAAMPLNQRRISHRTLEDWYYRWRKGGFEALHPKGRCDQGLSRAIDPSLGLWILEQVRSMSKVPLKVLYRRWRSQGHCLPSLNTIYRYLDRHQLGAKDRRPDPVLSGPTKAFESPRVNELWMVDFAHGPFLRPADSKQGIRTFLCLILDDHSRLAPYAAYYAKEDTAAFHHTLKEALLRRGVPDKLYTDNGSPFCCAHTQVACANLGVRLLHAKPGHSWSKGKVERLIRTVQTDFEAQTMQGPDAPQSIAALNQRLSLWLQEVYHSRQHSSTHQTPLARFQAQPEHIRSVPNPEAIDELFFHRLRRTVRKDGTVRLGNALYEVDLSLRSQNVELRFDPQIRNPIQVYYNNKRFADAQPLNIHLNSQLHPQRTYDK